MKVDLEKWQVKSLREYFGYNDKTSLEHWAYDVFNKALKEQLPIHSVVPMLPKMKSNEFESYLKNSGYERIDDELLQKGTDYYCINNVYRHFLNLIEFGN